jgi:Flp pilus assembly pilin Flp
LPRQFGAVSRLYRDETAVTTTEYVIVAVGVVLLTIAATRLLAGAMIGYLRRIYLVVTLPVP